jgi:hypothetical protein
MIRRLTSGSHSNKTWPHFVGAVSGATVIDLSYSLQCLLHLLFTATLFPSSVFYS